MAFFDKRSAISSETVPSSNQSSTAASSQSSVQRQASGSPMVAPKSRRRRCNECLSGTCAPVPSMEAAWSQTIECGATVHPRLASSSQRWKKWEWGLDLGHCSMYRWKQVVHRFQFLDRFRMRFHTPRTDAFFH
jgi:hypothetical protein